MRSMFLKDRLNFSIEHARVKEVGQEAIEYISVERIIAYSRMVKAGKWVKSRCLSVMKLTGLADGLAWVTVKKGSN